jgi:hypothetical protein
MAAFEDHAVRRGNLHAAHAACDKAARGAPGTELGKKAAERKAAIERHLQPSSRPRTQAGPQRGTPICA